MSAPEKPCRYRPLCQISFKCVQPFRCEKVTDRQSWRIYDISMDRQLFSKNLYNIFDSPICYAKACVLYLAECWDRWPLSLWIKKLPYSKYVRTANVRIVFFLSVDRGLCCIVTFWVVKVLNIIFLVIQFRGFALNPETW